MHPRESGEFVIKIAKNVKVNLSGIEKLADKFIEEYESNKTGKSNFSQSGLHPKPNDKNAVNWIFLIDTLNFCFWTPENDTKWSVNDYTGYFALCSAIDRAIESGMDITNPAYYVKLTLEQLNEIFRADDANTSIPLINERAACLKEVGTKLIDKYDGNFENCVKLANNSAKKLLQLIVEEFPCFRDEAIYAGNSVSLYKRAQILIGDLWACFNGEGLGCFKDIDYLTMFADYRVPQVLVHFGAIIYSPELLNVLNENQIMENGDPNEVEIRCASIFVVEELKKNILNKLQQNKYGISHQDINSVVLDHFLWDYRRKHAKELEYIPFHKVLNIYY